MQERKTNNLDHYATSEQERAQTTAKAGRKDYSRRSSKVSSQSRKKGGKAGRRRRRQRDKRDTVYKLVDLLPKETIKKLKELRR